MSELPSSTLSASASEFVPSFLSVPNKEIIANSSCDNVPPPTKVKKSKEMRGPRKRQKKPKGDNCSVVTSISHSQYGDEEDDAMSHLSLEGPYSGEYYEADRFDNLSYNHVPYPNTSYVNDEINPLARQSRLKCNPTFQNNSGKGSNLGTGAYNCLYEEYPGSPAEFAEFDNELLAGAHSAAGGDWSYWFDNVCEQFGRSSSPDNLSLPYLYKKRSSQKRTPSECSQDSWLDLQQEWVTSKQLVSESDDIGAEELERKKWGEWAVHASEKERQRRITAIEMMDAAQAEERVARGKWALEAIERERNDRISAHFLVSLASTNWFNETISAYSEDYELVCPYYRMGCKMSCRRSTLEMHLKLECLFARQIKDMDIASQHDNFKPDDYEIICPNAFMGCTFTCNRKGLHEHLLSCAFSGISKEQDLEERQLTKQAVIRECEDERTRRQKHLMKGSGYWSDQSDLSDRSRIKTKVKKHHREREDAESDSSLAPSHRAKPKDLLKGSTASPASSPLPFFSRNKRAVGGRRTSSRGSLGSNSQSLHHLLRSQVQLVVADLHDETAAAWICRLEEQRARRPSYEAILTSLRLSVAKLWHFCRVESYGSYSTGLSDSSSDLDLVVCFSDECQSLLGLKGVVPLMHLLAEYLTKEAGHLIHITNIIIHARVPIIKAVTVDPALHQHQHTHQHVNPHTPHSTHSDSVKFEPIHIDISIDSPLHSGLATTEMVCTLMQALPPLGPVVSVLKDYLKLKGLADAFTGGLNSYGLFILMLLPLLKKLRDSRDLLGCEPIGGPPPPVPVPVPVSVPVSASIPIPIPMSVPTSTPVSALASAAVTAPSTPTYVSAATYKTAIAIMSTLSTSPEDFKPFPNIASEIPPFVDSLLGSKDGEGNGSYCPLEETKSAPHNTNTRTSMNKDTSATSCGESSTVSLASDSAPPPIVTNKKTDKGNIRAALTSFTSSSSSSSSTQMKRTGSNTLERENVQPASNIKEDSSVAGHSSCSDAISPRNKVNPFPDVDIGSDLGSSQMLELNLDSELVLVPLDLSNLLDVCAVESDGKIKEKAVKGSCERAEKASEGVGGVGGTGTGGGGGTNVTSMYMEAVAKAALSKKNSSSAIKAHMTKGTLNRKLRDSSIKSEHDLPSLYYNQSTGSEESAASYDSYSSDTVPPHQYIQLASRDQSDTALSSSLIEGKCVPASQQSQRSSVSSPVNVPTSSSTVYSTPPCSSMMRRMSGGERNHLEVASSNTSSPTVRPFLAARPPLRPTPPITLKEYLSSKHLLHAAYTVARSALKPSQNNTCSASAPLSLSFSPSSSSLLSPGLSSPSPASSVSKGTGTFDPCGGIASKPCKSFVSSIASSSISSSAMASYQFLRPKSVGTFSRAQGNSPIASPKQYLGQMAAKKFPMRIMFSPPLFSPYKHASMPSSSSISKAGALYIMNVMNNQRGYTWSNLKQQREFGRKVAFKLLDSPDNLDFNRNNLRDGKTGNRRNCARDTRVPCVLPLEAPILGSLLHDFLLAYGEELQCGRHGYSARDYGFRFDIDVDSGSEDGSLSYREGARVGPLDGEVKEGGPSPIHPHAGDPLLVEDPVNVMNNVTKNCYKAPAVQKAFFEALERFKGIAVRRRPLNSSTALSPVISRRRFQFPASSLVPVPVPIGPHLVSPIRPHHAKISQSHTQTEVPSEEYKPLPSVDNCTVRESVTLDTAQASDTQQTAVRPNDVDKVNEVEVTDSIPAPLPRTAHLHILLPGDISPHGTTPTPTSNQTAVTPVTQEETYSLIKEIFGASSRQ